MGAALSPVLILEEKGNLSTNLVIEYTREYELDTSFRP